MAIDSKNLVVAAKVYSRGVALPLDASSVYESLGDAQAYAKNPIAYAGQVITVKEGEKYNAYILDGDAGAYTLSKVGVDASAVKNYVQVVSSLPGEGQEQGVIYINTTDNKGYIYDGSEFQVIFEDVTNEEGQSLSEQLAAIDAKFGSYAPLAGATFTGTVTLAADPTQNLEAATKQYVDRLVGGINDFTVGIVDSSTPLPATDYTVGQTFRVAEAGTYAGQECETGDLIIVIKDYAAEGASNSDFLVVQANVDGAVTGPDASTDANIVVFDGTTGRKIKDSTVTIASVQDAVAKAHEHANKAILDSFTKNETQLLGEVDSKISTALENVPTNDDLADYVTTETYNTKMGQLDSSISTLQTNLNTKITADDLAARIGEIPAETTIKDYVDTAVGSGDTDVAEQILQAKQEAIETAKTYTDTALTIVEF
jgi:hypothetical protein